MCIEGDRTEQINILKASDTTAMVPDSYIWGEITEACFFFFFKKKNFFKHDNKLFLSLLWCSEEFASDVFICHFYEKL